mmetsp:Transcript_28487/g.80490  ORF Transcript_28487/g.80490 Transcript_28487/m.80490 type:complete len:215 (+) Transcript_28487:280-924(+)
MKSHRGDVNVAREPLEPPDVLHVDGSWGVQVASALAVQQDEGAVRLVGAEVVRLQHQAPLMRLQLPALLRSDRERKPGEERVRVHFFHGGADEGQDLRAQPHQQAHGLGVQLEQGHAAAEPRVQLLPVLGHSRAAPQRLAHVPEAEEGEQAVVAQDLPPAADRRAVVRGELAAEQADAVAVGRAREHHLHEVQDGVRVDAGTVVQRPDLGVELL